jgi:hypothetical protein
MDCPGYSTPASEDIFLAHQVPVIEQDITLFAVAISPRKKMIPKIKKNFKVPRQKMAGVKN